MRIFLAAVCVLVSGFSFAQPAPSAQLPESHQTPLAGAQGSSLSPIRERFVERFDAANTTHDGRLTLAQAQAANMWFLVRHFSQIDVHNLGYVTLPEIKAWRAEHRWAHRPPMRQGQGESAGMPMSGQN
jgi:FlaG/FlaF family flagellin (archaellin)